MTQTTMMQYFQQKLICCKYTMYMCIILLRYNSVTNLNMRKNKQLYEWAALIVYGHLQSSNQIKASIQAKIQHINRI